jgi:hypothetical protein
MDIKTLAWSVLETPSFRDTAKRNFPPALFEGTPDHTHQALDDAIGQGMLLIRLLKLQDARRA